jgi:hypothetical protein
LNHEEHEGYEEKKKYNETIKNPMNGKPQPNHRIYLELLRRMTPDQRLRKALELTEFTRELFRLGLRKSHPHLSPEELHALYLARLEKCHNQNY